jgi:hypothetical protein
MYLDRAEGELGGQNFASNLAAFAMSVVRSSQGASHSPISFMSADLMEHLRQLPFRDLLTALAVATTRHDNKAAARLAPKGVRHRPASITRGSAGSGAL